MRNAKGITTSLLRSGGFWLVDKQAMEGYPLRTRVHPARFALRGYREIIGHYMRIRSLPL